MKPIRNIGVAGVGRITPCRQIVAVYSGSVDFNASASPPFTQVVT